MTRTNCCLSLTAAALAAIAGTIALAEPPSTKPGMKPSATMPAAQPKDGKMGEHAMPAGMSEADMKACMEAGTPGAMHAYLAKANGTWSGKTMMWMAPGTEPMKSECTSTCSSFMDGRFTKCEMAGDMPGMGAFNGFGIYGYDNVAQKFQCTWVDNMGTGMMQGTGELSSDQKTMTWNFNYHCPITKKASTMREVERVTGADTKTMEMFGEDPKTGKEFKMMEIALTRTSKATGKPSAAVTPDNQK